LVEFSLHELRKLSIARVLEAVAHLRVLAERRAHGRYLLGEALEVAVARRMLVRLEKDGERVERVERVDESLGGQERHVDLLERLDVARRLRFAQLVEEIVVARLGEEDVRCPVLDVVRVEVVDQVMNRLEI
jgi:hypothetical protein